MKRIITLVRHGKIDGPAALYGHTDVPLSAQGYQDLRGTIARIHHRLAITNIVSSPLIRCAQLAQEFSDEMNLPLHIIDDLKEMHFGTWDGEPFDNFSEAQWRELDQFWQTPNTAQPPGGEALPLFAQRVVNAWRLIQQAQQPHQLVICHGGVIRIIIAHLLHLDWTNPALFRQLTIDYASNTCVEILDHENALPTIRHIGENLNS